MTKQRHVILTIVQVSKAHPSAEDIFFAAKQRLPGIAMGTVYNNLNALTEQGVIRRVRISGGPDRYDWCLLPHDHMVCERCGAITDITIPDFTSNLQHQLHTPILSYDLVVHSVCDVCIGKEPVPARPISDRTSSLHPGLPFQQPASSTHPHAVAGSIGTDS